MPDTATVKRILARLASRESGSRSRLGDSMLFGRTRGYRTIIDRASAAEADLKTAVEFIEDDGITRLDGAIEDARAAEDHAAARRGQHAMSTLTRVRDAARGTTSDTPSTAETALQMAERDYDQFHSGRGTTLGSDTERGSK